MEMPCPHCRRVVTVNSTPIRGPANDGTEVWICLKCNQMVCSHPIMLGNDESIPCYMDHMSKSHPEMYGGKPKGSKKKK